MKRPSRPTTALEGHEPLTEEEQAQFAKERRQQWFYQTLDRLWFTALGDADMKEAFRDKAESLPTKSSPRSDSALYLLLIDYARAVEEFGDDKERILDKLINVNKRFYDAVISRDTMDNRVSHAIGNVNLTKLPEWAQKVIKDRQRKYRGRKK